MTDLDTVLPHRLRHLADELAPATDLHAQALGARTRYRRQRRNRIALLAVAAATSAVVVGTTTTVGLLSADRPGQVAGPGERTPATAPTTFPTVPTSPTTAPSASATDDGPGAGADALPPGWETRTFQGVSFAVPPGARMPDYVEPTPPADSDGGPTFIWNGPHLGGEAFAMIKVQTGFPPGDDTGPVPGAEPIIVPGALQASVLFSTVQIGNPHDPSVTIEVTSVMIDIEATDRTVHIIARFALGAEGQRMAEQLIASLAVG